MRGATARGPKPRGIRPGKGPIAKGAHGQATDPQPKGIRPGKGPKVKRGPRPGKGPKPRQAIAKRGTQPLILFYLCDK